VDFIDMRTPKIDGEYASASHYGISRLRGP
jgi:hypothetical protein